MIRLNNQEFKEAVKETRMSPQRLAFKSDGSPTVLKKILDDSTDFYLKNAAVMAENIGFDIEVTFVRRPSLPKDK